MKNIFITFLLLILIPLISYSQVDKGSISKREIRKQRPAYIEIGLGLNSSKFRDYATSPLFYRGAAKAIDIAFKKKDYKVESEAGLLYSYGNYSAIVENHISESVVKSISLNYSRLYQVEKLSNDKWNLKLGAKLDLSGNLRQNESLQNNALGIELIPTLFGSAKISRDISRKQIKQKKFLFIRYNLKPAKRTLSFRFNVGLVNASYRNGYVYAGQSAVLNEEKIFDDYEFKIFSGYRLGSSLSYKKYLKNDNAIELSYKWDAYSTGGELDKYQMAHHTLQFLLHFKTN